MLEGRAIKVGKVQGAVVLEWSWGRDEGLALVEVKICPIAEVGAGHLGLAGKRHARLVSVCMRTALHRIEPVHSQLLSPLKMPVVVDKVIAPLLQSTHIQSGVVGGLGRSVLAYRPRQDGGGEISDTLAVRSWRELERFYFGRGCC